MSPPAKQAMAVRHAAIAAWVRAARDGQVKPVYLIAGESFDTRAAADALVDAIVPTSQRAFNLEIYDGRTTPLGTVLDSLRTPAFLPGTKLVWVRESPLFLSGEKRSDVARSLLSAWAEGREREAMEKLLMLVALAGWTDEEFRAVRWSALPKARVREVCGDLAEAEDLAVLDAVQAACVAQALSVDRHRDDSALLLDALDAGLPPGAVLLFTAAAVDARKRVVKRLRELDAFVALEVARERSGALGREVVDSVVARVTAEFEKRLTPAARELVTRRAGSDLAMLVLELEKLCLYVGDAPAIDVDDVRCAFRDMAESWVFDFTTALATRELRRALVLLRGLLVQGEPPLRLLAMMSREVRLLLLARECLDTTLQGQWRAGAPYQAFQTRVLPLVDDDTRMAFGGAHPFALYRRFQDASKVSSAALRDALVQLSDLDVRLKSTRTDPALLLEAFVIGWCGA